jgi:Dehydrogenases with different specificities (related to short-chain alcohol dehydrogenases)
MGVQNRVALVTGSGSGLGEATAMMLAQNGAKVVVNDVVPEKVDQVVEKIKAVGGEVMGVVADISKKDQAQAMAKQIVERFGRIDILVNNAGISRDKGLLKLTEEDWDIVLNVNLKGPFLLTQAVVPFMKEQKFGRIVNIASRAYLGWPTQANYSASKGGLVSFSRSMALELAKSQITVNCIAPGLIQTPLYDALPDNIKENLVKSQPTGTIGKPEDIGYGVLFFADDDADYVTGQTIFICGGKSVLSSLSV